MKINKYLIQNDLDYLLDKIFCCEGPSSLINIARKSGKTFPFFQASIGQGLDPRIGNSSSLSSRHLLTWFKTEDSGLERIVIGSQNKNVDPLSSYYLGLWCSFGWKKNDKKLQELAQEMCGIGSIQIKSTWAWTVINPASTLDLGAFNAIFRE